MTRQLGPTDLKRLNRSWRRRLGGRAALVLDGVAQPYNLGSILRSAAALGVETVWLTEAGTDPRHPSSRKLSMGTEHNLVWEQKATAVDAVAAARAEGYRIIAVELARDATPIHETDLSGDVCLVLGHEDHGCAAATLAAVDTCVFIPQPGKVGSLNVAVAAAIALSELRRQGWMQDDAIDQPDP